MAKTDSVDITGLVKLTQVDFASASEENASAASPGKTGASLDSALNGLNKVKGGLSGFPNIDTALGKQGAAASPFTPPSKVEEPSGKTTNSIFGKIMCCQMPSFNTRKRSYGKAFLRDLKVANTTADMCADYKKEHPQDAGLNIGKMLNNNKNLLSPDSEDRWNALVKSELARNTKLLGVSASTIMCCIKKATNRSGAKTSNKLPLTARRKLKSLLNQDPCTAAVARDIGMSQFLSKSTGNALLDILLDGDPGQAKFYTDLAVNSLGLKGTVLGGLAEGIATGIGIRDKFTLIDRAKPTGKDLAYVKTDSVGIMSKLPEDEKSNGITFDEVELGLDYVDPNWMDKDGTIKAESMQNLVTDKLNSNMGEILLTGDYVTKLERVHKIAVINTLTDKVDNTLLTTA